MAAESSNYTTRVTKVTKPVAGVQLLVEANPGRVFLQIWIPAADPAVPTVFPGPADFGTFVGGPYSLFGEWKWKDAPSVVTGEFYCDTALVASYVLVECVKKGE